MTPSPSAAMQAAQNWQFMGNVFVADSVDRGPRVLYDRQVAAAGSLLGSAIIFFGHSVANQGQHVTNLLQPNRLPPPEAFLTCSIGFRISSEMLPADWLTIQKSYFWQLVIGRKPVMEGLLDQYPGGVGLWGFASTNSATAALVQSIDNGVPSIEAQRRFTEYPRIIPAEVNFSLNGQGRARRQRRRLRPGRYRAERGAGRRRSVGYAGCGGRGYGDHSGLWGDGSAYRFRRRVRRSGSIKEKAKPSGPL